VKAHFSMGSMAELKNHRYERKKWTIKRKVVFPEN
jgi:hypothetical protein